MLRLLMLSFLALSCCAQDAYTIAGRVVGHSDGQPLRGVRVSLAMTREARHEVSVISGQNGEFIVRGLSAGRYRLRATDHGLTRTYQQSDVYFTAIVAGPSLDTEHLVFAVETQASMSGKVVDDEKDPMLGLRVYLFRQSVEGGKYRISERAGAGTQTDGSFHFRHLEPGTYYLPWWGGLGMRKRPASHRIIPQSIWLTQQRTMQTGQARKERRRLS